MVETLQEDGVTDQGTESVERQQCPHLPLTLDLSGTRGT